jgi:hypothetical protein
MKIVLFIIMICFFFNLNAQTNSDNRHPEHFIAGFVFGGAASFFVFKKTNNKFKAWLIGTGTAVVIGLVKEAIDPSIGGERSAEDFAYTVLGGAVGASIVIPLKKSKPKKTAYLY